MILAQSGQSIPQQIVGTLQDTLANSITSAVNYVPSFVLGLAVLLMGLLIAWIVRMALVKVLSRVGFDRVIDSLGFTSGLEQANIKQSPSAIVGALAYWTILLNIMLSALKVMQFGEALAPLQKFINSIPAFIAAAITFVIGAIVAKFIGQVISGTLAGIGMDIHETLGNLARYFIMAIVTIVALQLIGLPVDLMNQILLAVIVIVAAGVALAFGLGGRQVTSNVLAGFYARELFAVGDRIMIDGEEGILAGLGTVSTEIETGNGVVTIPNTRLTSESIRKLDMPS